MTRRIGAQVTIIAATMIVGMACISIFRLQELSPRGAMGQMLWGMTGSLGLVSGSDRIAVGMQIANVCVVVGRAFVQYESVECPGAMTSAF